MSDTIIHRLRSLPLQDRRLVIILAATALVALLIGLAGGVLTALVRAGFLPALPESGYRFLTVHGVSAFFYWLYFAQAALLLGFAAARPRVEEQHRRPRGGDGLTLRTGLLQRRPPETQRRSPRQGRTERAARSDRGTAGTLAEQESGGGHAHHHG